MFVLGSPKLSHTLFAFTDVIRPRRVAPDAELAFDGADEGIDTDSGTERLKSTNC
jgi:hypothetical protein